MTESTYKLPHHQFGRVPIVIHLGDFLQLSPAGSLSLITDPNEKNEDGTWKYDPPPAVEVQHAIQVFGRIPHVIELKGTKRFKPGDPLIELLACMWYARRVPGTVWNAFEERIATDCTTGARDPRHDQEKFCTGYGLSWYWETLSRWISRRSTRDSHAMGVPLVFLQSVDEGFIGTPEQQNDYARRLLNVPNPGDTGHIHGVLPAHVGMRVRFTVKVCAARGLVQEQKATIVSLVFDPSDKDRHVLGEDFRRPLVGASLWFDYPFGNRERAQVCGP